MSFLFFLFLLPLLLPAAAAAAEVTKTNEISGVRTPQQLSCPAHSWLEEQRSYFLQSASTTTPKETETAAAAAAAEESHAFVELTEAALQLTLKKSPIAIVLYSDARCTDTSALALAFEGVAKAFARMSLLEPRVLFAKAVPDVGGSSRTPGMRQAQGEECRLRLFYKQKIPAEGEEGEGQETMVPFAKDSAVEDIKLLTVKLAFPPSLFAPNKELLEQLLFEFPRSLVRFFLRPSDVTPVPSAVSVAASRVPIFDVVDPSLAAHYQVEAPRQLLLGPHGFRESFSLDAKNDEEQLRLIRAVKEKGDSVLTFSSLTATSIFTELRPVVFFFGGAEPAIAEDFAFTTAAASFEESLAFASSLRPSALQIRAIDYLGLRGKRLPQVVIVRDIDKPKLTTKFICPDISSSAAITQCLNDFKEDKLIPYYKAAPPPKMQKGPVYELVASRYNAVVLGSSHEVLLLVYSPSCPHSAAFMPVFEELAVRVANEESLLVARMDGTANEVVGVNVPSRSTDKEKTAENGVYVHPDPVSLHGYPVIIFFAKKDPQKNTKVSIVYTGPRNADALRNFVVSQTALQAHEDL